MTASPTSADLASADRALVDSFKGGNENAFTELLHHHYERVHSLVLRLLRNRQDAEEITQDAFIRVHRGLANFRGDSSFSTWLCRIALNLARNRYWYWWRRRRDQHMCIDAPLTSEGDLTLADIIPSESYDAGEEAVFHEFIDGISGAMDRLTTKHHEILILRNVQGLSYEEIAAILNINVGTVKSRIARARLTLYWHLKSRGLADGIRIRTQQV
ncbi:MAG TPA: RNA polymerase sigma factor [Candidatus Paceibacterota bacterium]